MLTTAAIKAHFFLFGKNTSYFILILGTNAFVALLSADIGNPKMVVNELSSVIKEKRGLFLYFFKLHVKRTKYWDIVECTQ